MHVLVDASAQEGLSGPIDTLWPNHFKSVTWRDTCQQTVSFPLIGIIRTDSRLRQFLLLHLLLLLLVFIFRLQP